MPTACDTVFVVDPDESVHDALVTLMRSAGVRAACYRTPEAFLKAWAADSARACCLLVEADLAGMGSFALIRQVHAQAPRLPIVVLASTSDSDVAAQALRAGALDVIDKPLFGGHLLERILGVAATGQDVATP